jgi:PcRGLX-like protein central beta sandwich domain/PcRGLX-like N-terminal RIFT barrel domain
MRLFLTRCLIATLVLIAGRLSANSPSTWNTHDLRLVMDKWTYDNLDSAAVGRVRLLDKLIQQHSGQLMVKVKLVEAGTQKVIKSKNIILKNNVADFDFDPRPLAPGKYTVQIEVKNASGKIVKQAQYPLIRKQVAAVAQHGSIPLQLNIPKPATGLISPKMPFPVYVGIPLPRGAADETTEFSIVDDKKSIIPCQTEIMSTWGPKGTIRWLGVNFNLISTESQYSLKYGKKLPVPPEQRLKVTVIENNKTITINTGKAKFEILKSGFDGIHQAWLLDNSSQASHPLFDLKKQLSPYVKDQTGKIYKSSLDKYSKVTVELNGPQCAVIKATGWYIAADGSKISRYVIRIFAYSGMSWTKIMNTFIFCADSNKVKISDIGMPFSLAQVGTTAEFGIYPQSKEYTSKDISLLQTAKESFKIWSPNSGKVYKTGKHAAGWAAIQSPANKVKIAVGMRDFWQNYPKELTSKNGVLTMHIWPANGKDKPHKKLTDDNLADLWIFHNRKLLDFQVPDWFSSFKGSRRKRDYRYVKASQQSNGMGVARTSELFINLEPLKDAVTPQLSILLNNPPLLSASPQWMCASGVFGTIKPVNKADFPVIEQALEARFDGERKREYASFGMWNYGGSNTYYRYKKGSFDQLQRPWRLTHHGGPRIPWLLFARSGNRKYFDYAIKNSLRVADIGFCHYSPPEQGVVWGPDGKMKGAQCDYKGIVPWHSGSRMMDYNSMADFLHYYYYLTGNRWPFEVSEEWGELSRKNFHLKSRRSGAGLLNTLITLYEATGDMDYREIMERQFDYFVDHIMTKDGYFRHGNWYSYAPWLSRYYRLTGSTKAADAAVAWTDQIMKNQLLSPGNGTHADGFFYENGYPLYDVFRIAYKNSGNNNILKFALGCAKVVALSIFFDQNSPYYGQDMYSIHSLGGYYQQTVPFIMPLLKDYQNELVANYPRWGLLSNNKITLYVKASDKKPLKLMFGLKYPKQAPDTVTIYPNQVAPEGRYRLKLRNCVATEAEIKFKSCQKTTGRCDLGSNNGKPETGKLEVREVIVFKPTGNDLKKKSYINTTKNVYCQIELKPATLHGLTKIVLSRSDNKPLRIDLPMRTSRPAKIVFDWNKKLTFYRGSALYFRTPTGNAPVAVKARGRNGLALSLAFVNSQNRFTAIKQWVSNNNWTKLSSKPDANERGKIWCCLQSLRKYLNIQPDASDMPGYFSDRPERFFIPKNSQ